MANSWLGFIGIAIALEILVLMDIGKDLVKTLKRIEARMTLLKPLEEERKIMEGPRETFGIMTRSAIEDRAIQPDIWWHQYSAATRDLQGKELKEKRWQWRHKERTHRN